MKEYFQDPEGRAPYLHTRRDANDSLLEGNNISDLKTKEVNDTLDSVDEGDAAGGSLLRRVSSFHLLRSSSATPRPEIRQVVAPTVTFKAPESFEQGKIIPTWRSKERMKTVGIGLVMALNIGTDPPDLTKPQPCAKLQCWLDPSLGSRAKTKEKIGEQLEVQYASWQLTKGAKPLKFRRALDPTVEDVRALCLGLRRQAKNDRVILHYNGHGVPRVTNTGEIWVFDIKHTQYIPLCVTDLRQWLGKPSMVVLDCSSAGVLLPFLTAPLEVTPDPLKSIGPQGLSDDIDAVSSQWVRDTIVLCPTAANEWLPMHPDYPADIFTSCLTTPIQMALRWFVLRNPQSMQGMNPGDVDLVPGKPTDRKTPLGELHWIFTAITDSIAWNLLPKPLFQRLFRQDLVMASMFRNFLLADRILRSLNCSPQSYPPLPPGVCDHPLWQAWDLVCETCLTGLIRDGIIGTTSAVPTSSGDEGEEKKIAPTATEITIPHGMVSSISSPFFSEQLTAFEIWLDFALIHRNTSHRTQDPNELPEQLPVVLQVLLFHANRVRALMLLCRFLDLGPWAVNLALSLGIYPYVMKLLQIADSGHKLHLVGIWAKILAFDSSCQVDLVKDGTLPHFIHHLTWGLGEGTLKTISDPRESAEQRIMAAFILTVICFDYPPGQSECVRLNLHGACCELLTLMTLEEYASNDPDSLIKVTMTEQRVPTKFRVWLCLCLGTLMRDNFKIQNEAFAAEVQLTLVSRMHHDMAPDVRAASCYGLGCMLGSLELPGSEMSGGSTVIQNNSQGQHSSPLSVTGGPMQLSLPPSHSVGLPQQSIAMLPEGAISSGFPGRLLPTFGPDSGYVAPWNFQPFPNGTVQVDMSGQFTPVLQVRSMPSNVCNRTSQPPEIGSPIELVRSGLQSQPQYQTGHTFLATQNQIAFSASHEESILTDSRQTIPTVFDDRRRLKLDLGLMEALVRASKDASPLVRYEAAVSLARAVEKYLPAFLAVSDEIALAYNRSDDNGEPTTPTKGLDGTTSPRFRIDPPRGMNGETLDKFREVWKCIKDLKNCDPHREIALTANSIVSCVHENILVLKLQTEPTCKQSQQTRRKQVNEGGNTNESEHMYTRVASSGMLSFSATNPPATDVPRHRLGNEPHNLPTPLRRISSELGGPLLGNRGFRATSIGSSEQGNKPADASDSHFALKYEFPKSQLLAWKIDSFIVIDEDCKSNVQVYDPLSSRGASIAYQARRNAKIHQQCKKYSDYYATLLPKPLETISWNEEIDATKRNVILAEEELNLKKKSLQLKQTKVLKNEAEEMINILTFHPYEDFLLVCHGRNNVSEWNTNSGSRSHTFVNGNPKGSRMTSTSWVNSTSSSLFAIGCDDGSVRIWSGLASEQGKNIPTLESAFFAISGMNPDSSGSGIVLEWQQYCGRLVAGGNSKIIQCWDLGAEKCTRVLETQTDTCVTTISTAWNEGISRPAKHVGIGPDVIIAGFSDGAIRTFDLRTRNSTNAALENRVRGSESQHYKEHGSWIVSTAFTDYGGNYEIVSGSFSGEIKIWDLRFSTSLRTHNVQRSPMTALAIHPSIPLIATGSHAQFIKLFSLDGDTLEVIRYHEEMAGHRIGPVGCLAFHPHKPVLASGGTDAIVGIYAPKSAVLL